MKFKKPNFEYEWEEAKNRKKLFSSKKDWLKIAQTGSVQKIDCSMDVSNTEMCDETPLEDLHPEKVERAKQALKSGIVELPIILHVEDRHDVLAGNTRLVAMNRANLPVYAWVIELPNNTIDDLEIDGYSEEDFYKFMKDDKKDIDETEQLKGGLSDNMSLGDIANKHKVNIDTLTKEYIKGVKVEMEHTKDKNLAKEIAMDHLVEDPEYYTKLNKVEAKEQTTASSSGSFEPAFGTVILKKDLYKNHNSKKYKLSEATDASSSGPYDVPFGDGSKNPLKINGIKSIKKSRAVRDKNFPKWGGPQSVFIKVKEKCKKYPYCNQGIDALELLEIEGLKESIEEISKKYGIPYKEMEKIVINEINKIFI